MHASQLFVFDFESLSALNSTLKDTSADVRFVYKVAVGMTP